MTLPVTVDDIRRAAAQIGEQVLNTPCVPSRVISELAGTAVFLKFENLQFTASFKERGALVKLLSLSPAQRAQGVIAMSAGNHAQAVAYHAQRLGVPAVIVMPRNTPNVKVEHTRAFGAEVILRGEQLDEASAYSKRLAQKRGLHLIHPYDDPLVIAGQGTIVVEMLALVPDLDALVIPVGGGGLISGCAIAAKAIRPEIEVIGVQSSRYPAMLQALRGKPIKCGHSTIAEGIAVKQPGEITRRIIRQLVAELLLVEEDDIERAVLTLLEIEKTVVEGAGAAGLAALFRYRKRFAGRKVGLILCGGNIDLMLLCEIIQRGLVRSGRLVRLQVELADQPGSLAAVTSCISDAEANVVSVAHHRRFTHLPVKSTQLEFVLSTRGIDHLREVVAKLRAAGYQTKVPAEDEELLSGGTENALTIPCPPGQDSPP
jgi:threonine dehydratase